MSLRGVCHCECEGCVCEGVSLARGGVCEVIRDTGM